MKAVLEEFEGEVARLVPDDGSDPIHVNLEYLPDECTLGDVFEVVYQKKDTLRIQELILLSNEKEQRMERMKAKREALLKRTKEQQ